MNSTADDRVWDCIIVGSGPAGLNAALVLGRARRRVLVLDNAQPRNYATHEMHGVLGHDGLDPADLRAHGRAELARYGVDVVTAAVEDAEVLDRSAGLVSARGSDVARTVLLATGMLDEVPDIPGFVEVWGQRAHRPLLRRVRASRRATRRRPATPVFRRPSSCSPTAHTLSPATSSTVEGPGVPTIETPVVALDADGAGRLRRVRLDDGATLDCDALFFYVGWQVVHRAVSHGWALAEHQLDHRHRHRAEARREHAPSGRRASLRARRPRADALSPPHR